MPKQKTHKGLAKRVKVTAKGKLKHRTNFTGHLMSGKSGNRKRALRKPSYVSECFEKRMRRMLGV